MVRLQGFWRLHFHQYDALFLHLQQVTLMRMNRQVRIQIPPRDACFQRKPCQIKAQPRTRIKLPISRRTWLLPNLREFPLNSFYVNKWLNDSQTLITILSSSLNSQPHQRLFTWKQIKAVGLWFFFYGPHVYIWKEIRKYFHVMTGGYIIHYHRMEIWGMFIKASCFCS